MSAHDDAFLGAALQAMRGPGPGAAAERPSRADEQRDPEAKAQQ